MSQPQGPNWQGPGARGDGARLKRVAGQFLVPADFDELPAYAPECREFPYNRLIIPILKAVLRAQGLKIKVTGAENVPATGGGLLAANHTNYFDFIFAQIPAHLRGRRLTRFMAKKEVFEVPVVGGLMRAMHHLPVDRAAGAGSLDAAVAGLCAGNLVGIFPEATLSRSFELKDFKTGAVRIADQAGVPLIPMVTWGGQRVWTKDLKKNLGRSKLPIVIKVGSPVDPSGDPVEATSRLRAAMADLLGQARAEYDAAFGPFGSGLAWRPRSQGGSAPTLEQAAEIDARERAERRARREAKRR